MHNFQFRYTPAILFLVGLLSACGGGSDGSNNDGGNNNEQQGNNEEQVVDECTTTLDTWISDLQNTIPSWDEIDCFIGDNERLTKPAMTVRGLASSGVISPSMDYFAEVLDYWDTLSADYSGNLSSQVFGMLPPYYVDSWNPDTGQEYYLDERLRAAAVAYTREKQLGRPILMIAFTPPQLESPVFDDSDEFFTWLRNVFIPVKIQEAQAAELIKVESYVPWPLEMEVFIRDVGGDGNGGFLESMTDGEKIQFGQSIINEIRDAVRPHFSGTLVAHSYHNYWQAGTVWNQLSYDGFDEIHFAFFATCDVESTSAYMDAQLANYQMVVENSGNIPWQANEISVGENLFNCDTPLDTIEQQVYQTIFEKLMNAENPPIGLSVSTVDILTEDARQYIQSYFNGLVVNP